MMKAGQPACASDLPRCTIAVGDPAREHWTGQLDAKATSPATAITSTMVRLSFCPVTVMTTRRDDAASERPDTDVGEVGHAGQIAAVVLGVVQHDEGYIADEDAEERWRHCRVEDQQRQDDQAE